MTSAGMSGACKVCGGVNLEIEDRGSKVCRDCGHVLEDSCIVSEVQFEENARGGANVIGQYVGESNRFHIDGFNSYTGFGRESREITLENGKRRIKEVASQLGLNATCIDMAFNFYKMAVSRHLTRGRKTDYVVAACIYLVCRTENIPHMLLDLSDIVSVNVYYLGRTYLKLSNELCIKASAIDPCLYIHRFAELLDFGEKVHDVSTTALRLVHRMKRDWMHTGRRPSGLCGAALVVAARLHNFNRTIEDVTKVVRMSHATIRKRLLEFEETPTAELTLEEFNHVNLESECDPPCFTEGKKKAALLQQQLENTNVDEEVTELELLIEEQLEKDVARRNRRFRKYLDCDEDEYGSDAGSMKSGLTSATNDTFKEEDFQKLKAFAKKFKFEDEEGGEGDITEAEFKILAQTTLEEITGMKKSRPTTPEQDLAEDGEDGVDPEVARLEAEEMQNILDMPTSAPPGLGIGIAETVKKCMEKGSSSKIKAEPSEDEDEDDDDDGKDEKGDPEIDLDGIDDEEIDGLLLSEEEVKVKTLVWCRLNALYLQEETAKKRQEAEDLANGVIKKPPRTKRTKPGGGSSKSGSNKNAGEAATATEAVEKMLKEKKISTKINYDVLKNLESDPLILGGYTTTATASHSTSSFRPQEKSSLFKSPTRVFAPTSGSATDSKPLFNHSRFKRKIEPGAPIKDEADGGIKRRQFNAGPNVASAGRKTADISKVKNLTTKGKVLKEVLKEAMKSEEEDDEDEDDEEEQAVSVTEMFNSQFGKEENDYDDYDSG